MFDLPSHCGSVPTSCPATATLNATFNPRQQTRHAPARSSPLACSHSAAPGKGSASVNGLPSVGAQRVHAFPTSRPLRPFASIAPKSASKPVKSFELPDAFKSGCFMLNLSQAEFSRQE